MGKEDVELEESKVNKEVIHFSLGL